MSIQKKNKQRYTYFKGEICVKWNIGNLSFNLFGFIQTLLLKLTTYHLSSKLVNPSVMRRPCDH